MPERAGFLDRVRTSLAAADEAATTSPVEAPGEPEVSLAQLAELFRASAVEADAEVSRAASLEEARDRVVELIHRFDANEVLRADTPLLRALELAPVGFQLGVAASPADEESRRELRAAAARATLGLTEADWGIAESGTLVLRHRPGQGRSVSLLPPVHVALLRTRDLVPDLPRLFARLGRDGEPLPSALTFITGPSRTGDIEFVLTLGVHGPENVHIILLEDGVG